MNTKNAISWIETKELVPIFETCQAVEDLLMETEELADNLFYSQLLHNPALDGLLKVSTDKKEQEELFLLLIRVMEVRHLASICEARINSCEEFLIKRVRVKTPIPVLVEIATRNVREKRLARNEKSI